MTHPKTQDQDHKDQASLKEPKWGWGMWRGNKIIEPYEGGRKREWEAGFYVKGPPTAVFESLSVPFLSSQLLQ